ncbi:hypothetical protein ACIBO9_13655 [Streptomyces prunicolor]|uniref:hypothetical protein n=1 Tax=Streptomyces prunicolor TaxID=67348 RepID=UPI0037D10104
MRFEADPLPPPVRSTVASLVGRWVDERTAGAAGDRDRATTAHALTITPALA